MKNNRLSIVLTSEEKLILIRLATAEGCLSQAALIRRLILLAARELFASDVQKETNQVGDHDG